MKEERSFHRNDCPHPWLVLSATSLGAVLTAINGSILTAALPVVVRHFNAGPRASNWILLSYMFPVTILIVSFGRLADAFGRVRLGEALGINTMIVSVGQLLGPVLGGLVAATLGWRWLFWLNVPLGIPAIAWAGLALRGLRSPTRREPLDVPGSLLSGRASRWSIPPYSGTGAMHWRTRPLS